MAKKTKSRIILHFYFLIVSLFSDILLLEKLFRLARDSNLILNNSPIPLYCILEMRKNDQKGNDEKLLALVLIFCYAQSYSHQGCRMRSISDCSIEQIQQVFK